MATTKVCICLPATGDVKALFAIDLAKLVQHTAMEYPDLKVITMLCQGSMIPRQRQILADAALKSGADYLLWLDTDMRFPKDALLGMLNRDKPIIAATYTERMPPFRSVAFIDAENLSKRLYVTPDSTGLEPVFAVGFGCILVRRDVFEAMDKPYFAVPWAPEAGVFLGEDIFFCGQARRKGFEVLIDHDLSKQVVHIGQHQFDFQHALAAREAEVAAASQQEK